MFTFFVLIMKKKLFCLLFCSGMIVSLAAQKIEVKEPRLIKEAGTEAYHPVFTPDGKTILLSSESYAGLRSFNLETKKVRILTDATGAGWNLAISDDSQSACFQKIDPNADFRDAKSFYSVNLDNQQVQRVMSPVEDSSTRPVLLMKSKAAIKSPVIAYASEDLQIVVEKNGKQTILTPNGTDETYMWVELSPDKTKIVYNVSSIGETFICDLSGKVLANLGRLSAPQWLNKDYVVGMNDFDDGHVVVKSNIIGISANGKVRQELTQLGDKIAMFPAVSPDGSKIAFNTLKGELYIMEVVVK